MALDIDYNDSFYYQYMDDYENAVVFSETRSTIHLFYPVCWILILCIGIPGNCFLLWVLLRERAWRTASDILLLQLPISNLCFTVRLPFEAYLSLHHGGSVGNWGCVVMTVAFFLGLNSCVLILTTMTLYRYAAVVHGSYLSAQSPKKSSVVMSCMIWLGCAAINIRTIVSRMVREDRFGDFFCLHAPPSHSMLLYYDIVQIVSFFIIPFIVISCCYIHMWITQCRTNRQHQSSGLISGMIVIIFICLAPYNIRKFTVVLMMFGVLKIADEWREELHHAELIVFTLLFLHCCLNPLFYIFGAQRFRKHLRMPYNTSSQRGDRGQNLSSMAVIPPHDTSV
ncbi:chemokine XC receptor 1-like [Plectropomus leopardus]|uniref:chemokine XC receptor 1-like n=1 Tax=Plectropomus leopardus TaxID=160734 RepID=UPI001C4B31D5|nr:chemokine XC receptor 1-like [Plectropomus leopardus]